MISFISNIQDKFEIIHANSLFEAKNIVKDRVPDLIIIHHDRKTLNGLEFIKELKKRSSTAYYILFLNYFSKDLLQKTLKLKIDRILKFSVNISDSVQILLKEIEELNKGQKSFINSLLEDSTLFSDLKEGVIIIDLELNVLYVNNSFESLSNINLDTIFSKKIDQIFNFKISGKKIINLIKEGEINIFDVPFIDQHNRQKHFRFNFNPIFEKNKISGTLVFVWDISNQKRNENYITSVNEQVIRNLEDHQKILNSFPDLIFRLNRERIILDFHIPPSTEFINHKKRNPYSQLNQIKIDHFLKSPELINKFDMAINFSLDNKIHESLEYKFNKADKTLYKEARFSPSGENEIICIIRDITESKINEFVANQQLIMSQLTNKELYDISLFLAHELKAPMQAIAILLNIFLKENMENLSKNSFSSLKEINSKVETMTFLLEDMIKYSRIGYEKSEEEFVDLNVLLKEIIDIINPHSNINIQIKSKLPSIRGHKIRLFQLFQNLISNAIKFNDKAQGSIEISFQTKNSTFYEFSVKDNGPGIHKNKIRNIFNIFETGDLDVSNLSTGIGLAIVRKIVELLGGNIWVDSNLGLGSKFTFILPIKNSQNF